MQAISLSCDIVSTLVAAFDESYKKELALALGTLSQNPSLTSVDCKALEKNLPNAKIIPQDE